MRKTRIFTPGPTPLMPEAQLAMARPILHHRTAQFRQVLLETRQNLQKIFKTENDVVILAASGTGAMEAAVCNLLSPQDRALAVVAGKFGERWQEICSAFSVPCVALRKDSGQAASAEEICQVLAREKTIAALLLQGCETSTATSHNLEGIGCRIRADFPQVLMVVDAITALGSQPLETDTWGLDVVISGSQKSFALPPGLAFLALSARAIEKMRSSNSPRYYFDLLKELKAQKEGQTAFTPAVSLVAALNETCREILGQGLEQVLQETDLMARCTRRALLALGFRLLSASPAAAATAAFPPDGVGSGDLIDRLGQRFGIRIAGGQGDLKGKIIRIAHLGYFDLPDVFSLLSALELCLLELGARFEPGSGVRAAMLEAQRAQV